MFRESNNIFFNINNDFLSKNKNEIESKHSRINNNSLNIHINDKKKINNRKSNYNTKSPSSKTKMSKSNTIVYKTLSNTNTNTPKKISTISDLKLSFNKQLVEKDLKIERLQKELIYYKTQYMKLYKQNKQFSPIKTSTLNNNPHQKNKNLSNRNFNYISTTIQPMKNSFEYNNNKPYIKKQHERELSERINNFYTPKANELIRNFNSKKNRSVNKIHFNHNGIFSYSITGRKKSASKQKKIENNTQNNYANNLNDIIKRMNKIVEIMFEYKIK